MTARTVCHKLQAGTLVLLRQLQVLLHYFLVLPADYILVCADLLASCNTPAEVGLKARVGYLSLTSH
jgi:predicted small secreted protein